MKEAWAQGYTGRGIVVSILDDGIEKNHPDLAGNYVRRWRREAAVPGERHLAGGGVGGWSKRVLCPVPFYPCGQADPDGGHVLSRILGPASMSTTRTRTPSLGTHR